ncbi:MAG TPA: alpha-L-rhamnosidase N-terminal domain-containing protein [Chitinophagaceae bacterium]|nr:alpha-L-rhamnosidase N-terminal domain-containing protein [Chitinophagaceae bacterium]
MKKWVIVFILFIISCGVAKSQTINPSLLTKTWSASWITVPDAPAKNYGVYYFRKEVSFAEKPGSFIVHISADNRYVLIINEKFVSIGPARNDLFHWNFETVDIADYLIEGANVITATVWNEGEYRPEGQISNRTGFLMQGNTSGEEIINSNTSWKCFKSAAYKPLTGIEYNTYYVSGPGELVDMNLMPDGWQKKDFDDNAWPNAVRVGWRGATPKGVVDIADWMLVPSTLPPMELRVQRFAAVRTSKGVTIPTGFPATKTPITIPANTHASFLLDQSFYTNAYPELDFSKGKDAGISLTYAEALFIEKPDSAGKTFKKGNRNEVEGKIISGRKDSIISNGKNNQYYSTLSWRTFRYIEVRITTKDEPLIIEDIYSLFTGYPFQLNAAFDANDETLEKIFEVGWRTARACAWETYMDCPYYEQLQYIGDTRIQALVSFYNSGDDRLVRNAITQMDHSRMAEGITLSRHPSFSPQQIPTFSLWYIGMVNDYWMYRGDRAFIKDKLQGTRNVLWFFSKYQNSDGSLRNVPYWIFTDWVEGKTGWPGGVGPIGIDGSSALLDLQLLWALQVAARLERELGLSAIANEYQKKAILLQQTIQRNYWEPNKKLYADTKDKDKFSQHANTLAILTNTIKGSAATDLAKRIIGDTSLSPASIYFKYYLHMALTKAGLGNDYLKWLDKWKENIEMGLTTWAEISEIDNARSDCHAWGASPNIEFFRTVLGLDTDAPGFKKVRIEPHLGELKNVKGKMPHPDGFILANYKLVNAKWNIEITLPEKISGRFIWKGKTYSLKPGTNNFSL